MSYHHKIISINSYDRENFNTSKPSDCIVKLPSAVKNNNKLELLYFQMPNTYYNITSQNNKLTINETEYTLTHGSYTLYNLLSNLKELIAVEITNIDIQYSEILGLIRFENLDFPLQFECNTELTRILGFKSGQTKSGTVITGDFPPKIYQQNIFINISRSSDVMTSVKNLGGCSIVVPNNVNHNSFITYSSKSQYRHLLRVEEDLEYIEIQIRDIYGNIIQNPGEFLMILRVIP